MLSATIAGSPSLYRRSSLTWPVPGFVVHTGGPPGGVELIAQVLVEGRQVPIAIEGELDAGVAQSLLDLLGRRATGYPQRRARVAQIVEPESRRDSGPVRPQVCNGGVASAPKQPTERGVVRGTNDNLQLSLLEDLGSAFSWRRVREISRSLVYEAGFGPA